MSSRRMHYCVVYSRSIVLVGSPLACVMSSTGHEVLSQTVKLLRHRGVRCFVQFRLRINGVLENDQAGTVQAQT